MRKTIIFGAIAALFGLVAAAQANNDDVQPTITTSGQVTYSDHDDGGDTAGHRVRERTEYRVRDRDHDAYERSKKARERKHREHNDRD
jgi:hypothetical protein